MLPLSANSDFQNHGELYKPTNYIDINGDDLYHTSVVYGTDAIDQAIEAVIVTEPWERLFNVDFWSPFYRLLFNQEQWKCGVGFKRFGFDIEIHFRILTCNIFVFTGCVFNAVGVFWLSDKWFS